jgi:hypothetical protein
VIWIEGRARSRVAVIIGDVALILHRPHPQKEIAKYVVRDLRSYLTSLGITP